MLPATIDQSVVFISNGKIWTDSLKLAEAFNQQHKNLLQKIERILAETPEEFRRLNFQLSSYGERIITRRLESSPA